MNTIYRIRSTALKQKGERIEGLDKARMERRLKEVQRHTDPQAKIIAVPVAR